MQALGTIGNRAGRSLLPAAYVLGDRRKLLQGCGQVSGDVRGNRLGVGQIGGFFQRVVLEPEEVEVEFVAFGELFVGEGFEAFTLFAAVAVLLVVALDEFV
jgi:hypothetical protein